MKNNILKKFLEAIEYPKLLALLARSCQTPTGRDYLEAFRPLAEANALTTRLDRTRELERFAAKHKLPAIPDPQHFIEAFGKARVQGDILLGKELAALVQFLGEVTRLRQGLSTEEAVPAVFQEWLSRLNGLPELSDSIKSRISDRGEVLDGASSELKSVRDQLKNLRSDIQRFYQSFLQNSGTAEALQEKIVTEREGRLVVPVKREHQSLVPGFVHGVSASGSTLFVEPRDMVENNNQVKEALLREDEEVRKVLREATQEVLGNAEKLETTLIACAEIDAHQALAAFAAKYDGAFLKPEPSAPLVLKNARHPLLALEASNQFRDKVIPLEAELGPGVQVLLLSGPNAGGKTVALKTLGLSCVMAQAGLPVLASEQSRIPVLGHFDTDLEDEQDLGDHLSTYAAKLKALKRMLDHAGSGTLLLLDELGAGTDPREGGALGLACLEDFRDKGAWVFANTHQPLLKLLTQEEKGMANAAMLFDEGTGKPTFRLVPGIPGQSYALTLAKQMGFSPQILEKAKAHLPQGEADLSELLAKLGAEKQAAEQARQEAEKRRDAAKKLEQELLTAKRQIKDEAKNIKKQAQIEAEGLLKNTRRQMEHIIQGVQKPGGTPNKDRIKDARQHVDQKLRNIAPKPQKQVVEVRDLKEGDVLFHKKAQVDVKVISVDEEKEEAVILMENGMKMTCKWADLGKVTTISPKPVARPQVAQVIGSKSLEEKGKLELDLRGKLVDQALPVLDKFLDDALLVNLPFVRIIHGKGTGALKVAIHKHLPQAHPGVEFTLAEPNQGGAGVTVIKFKK